MNIRAIEDKICEMSILEHCVLYNCSGEVELMDGGKKIILKAGDCAFIRRDIKVVMHKRSCKKAKTYQSILLRFTRKFLREFYKKLDKATIPNEVTRSKESVIKLKVTPDIQSLFDSILPFFNSDIEPTEQWLNMKLMEGLYVLLNADKSIYASLFDFTDAWKIDIMDFMNENYMHDLSMEELARYTGRSLTTFKRDFKKVSELTPEKWIVRKRLETAHDMIAREGKKVKDVLLDVGFKNMSHFSRIYKQMYGIAPSMN